MDRDHRLILILMVFVVITGALILLLGGR